MALFYPAAEKKENLDSSSLTCSDSAFNRDTLFVMQSSIEVQNSFQGDQNIQNSKYSELLQWFQLRSVVFGKFP